MPDKDGQGEDGVDWLASQLGGGARPASPDEFVPRKGAPRRPKAVPVEPAPGEAAPKTAGFLWGLKPTTETDPHVTSTDVAVPPVSPATPERPSAPTPAPVPAASVPRPATPVPSAGIGQRAEPLAPAQSADLRPATPTPARAAGHTP
ncbi:hypothetical protein E3O19_08095, partial [Cryobacterium algoritolerans]